MYRFFIQFLTESFKLSGLVLHLLAFLVIVDRQFLQGLQNLLHFLFGRFVLSQQAVQFGLQDVVVTLR